MAFTPARRRHGHGDPLLQGRGQRRHPHRLAVDGRRVPGWPPSPSPTRRATGWQSATLATPLAGDGGHDLRRVLLRTAGPLLGDVAGSSAARSRPGDLTAPATNNGRYLYGAAGGFPTYSLGAANYFVDVVFERAAASLTVDGTDAAVRCTGRCRVTAKPSITFSAPLAHGLVDDARRSGYAGRRHGSAVGRRTHLTFTPGRAAGGRHRLHGRRSPGVTSTDGASLPTQSWSFTTGRDDAGTTSLFADVTPATARGRRHVGRSSSAPRSPRRRNGTVTAVRFYKGAGNTGTHVGSLWDAGGGRLGQVTFTNETATGWQTATFATPVAVTAGTTYVVSYYAPDGPLRVHRRATSRQPRDRRPADGAVRRQRPSTATAPAAASRPGPGTRPTTSSTWSSARRRRDPDPVG